MTAVPARVRRADCGHWVPEELPPVAVTEGGPAGDQNVTLCNQCWEQARNQRAPKVETKTERRTLEPEGQAIEVEVTRAKPERKSKSP